LSTCDPKEIIEDALAATSGLFKEKGIVLEPEFAPDLPRITVDRDRLMQVVINLLSNAAKFAEPDGGRVTVRLAREQDRLAVSVEDNGPGIPPEESEAVFDRFHQLRGDGAGGKPKGWGLGLTICRQIVEHFGVGSGRSPPTPEAPCSASPCRARWPRPARTEPLRPGASARSAGAARRAGRRSPGARSPPRIPSAG